MTPEKDWDGREKFRAETIRTGLLAIIGVAASYTLLKPWDSVISHSAEIRRTELTVSSHVVDEFVNAVSDYTAVAYDACRGEDAMHDLRFISTTPTGAPYEQELTKAYAERLAKNRVAYIDTAFDRVLSAESRLRIYFASKPKVLTHLNAMRSAYETLHKTCLNEPRSVWNDARTKVLAESQAAATEALASVGFTGAVGAPDAGVQTDEK